MNSKRNERFLAAAYDAARKAPAEPFRPGAADAGLMSLVRVRVDQGWPMAQIAAEVGWEVGALCDWVLAYREPRRQRFANRDGGPRALAADRALREAYFGERSSREAARDSLSVSENARRFAAWRKSHQGAGETLDVLSKPTARRS